MRTTAVIAAAALALAAPVAAQQHADTAQAGHRGMGMGMGGGMGDAMGMEMMHGGIAAMVALKEPLELSAELVQRLEALQASAAQEAEHHTHMAMEARHAAMMAIHHGEVDLAVHEAKLKEATSHQVMADMVHATKLAEARSLLTAEQRTRLDFAMEVVRALMMSHGAAGHAHGGTGGR